jgi:prepilin-type processing-associated H-X9-DG protein
VFWTNNTAAGTQIKNFVCPSDPNGGAGGSATVKGIVFPDINSSNYYACVGTTTYLTLASGAADSIQQWNVPSTGMFTFQRVYGIRDCTDGTSNTIAYAESLVGPPTSRAGQRGTGVTNVSGAAAAMAMDAYSLPLTTINSALSACDSAFVSGSGLDGQHGRDWSHGAMAQTLFNTIVTPNSVQHKWAHCSCISSSVVGVFSNAASYHAGGANALMSDGSCKFIKDSVARNTWWALGTRADGEVIDASAY